MRDLFYFLDVLIANEANERTHLLSRGSLHLSLLKTIDYTYPLDIISSELPSIFLLQIVMLVFNPHPIKVGFIFMVGIFITPSK
jgi:hypothetical protein